MQQCHSFAMTVLMMMMMMMMMMMTMMNDGRRKKKKKKLENRHVERTKTEKGTAAACVFPTLDRPPSPLPSSSSSPSNRSLLLLR